MIRILHIDDNEEDYLLVKRELKRHSKDLQIDWAESAQTALGTLAKAGHDCVLCDYQMPEMDGLQLLHKLRERGDQTPFIFLTGQGSEEIAAEALRAGADDYYTKEVGFAHYERLINSIARVVEAKEQRDEHRRANEKVRHLNLVLRAIRNVNQLITKESDIDKILDGACESLVETRGYDCACIALFDEAVSLTTTTGAGINMDFKLLEKYLQAGKPVSCVLESLRQPGVMARVKTGETCGECPFLNLEAEQGSMTVRLEHANTVYGVLIVSITPEQIPDREEQSLFSEVARDISLALHRNEIEQRRKRAEEETRRSEERYRKLFEHAQDGIILADATTGEIIDCNQAAANLVERSKAELIGQHQSILHPPDDATVVFPESFKKHIEDSEGEILEARVITSAGKIKDVVIRANLFDLGDRKLLQEMLSDVTERKRSDEAIKEKATRLELIAQVGQSTTAILGLYELLHYAVRLIGDTFDYVNVVILLVDGDELVLKAATLPSVKALEERIRLRIGSEGITGWVAGSGEPLLVPDVTLDTRYYAAVETMGTKSELAVPIKLKGKVIGVLDTQSVELNAFSQADVFTLQTIANQLAVAIDNARLYEAAQQEISERKRTEEALRAFVQKYRRLFESNIAGVYRTTLDGGILECNEAFARMFGYDSIEEITAVRAHELYFTDEDRGSFISQLKRQRDISNQEYRLKKKDGTEVWILEHSTLLNDDTIQGILTDITERKRAEEKLQRRTKDLGERVKELNCLYTISQLIETPGTSIEEIIKGTIDAIPPSWRYPELTCARVTLNERQFKTTSFKESRWKLSSEIIVLGAPVGCVEVYYSEGKPEADEGPFLKEEKRLIDEIAERLALIIERRRAEEALQESEEKFRELASLLPQPVFEIDARGRYTFLNSIGYEMSGYTREEIFKGLHPLRFFLPEDRPGLVKSFRKMLGGKEIPASEFTILRKDGSAFQAILHTALIMREGKPAGIRGIIFDITRRKQAEQELKESLDQLERRTIELEGVNKELEAFSYSVSHDLRAPLRHLSGFSQILLDGFADQLDEKGKEYLHKIIASSQQMSRLIDDLLRLSHLTRSKLSIGPVNLSALARVVVSQLQASEPKRKASFEIADGLEAEADARLMQIVLENLLGNAWKFSVKKKKAKIEFGATEREGKREFFIRDNGVGFNPAWVDKLFVAFQRLHTGSEFKGSGIGLATVQRIIHRHGGRIWAEGEVGKGATFYFTLD